MRGYYRHTKIIATIGPATESAERLAQLINAGVDVIRLNMAHGTGEWVLELVRRIRRVSAEVGRHVAALVPDGATVVSRFRLSPERTLLQQRTSGPPPWPPSRT